MDFFDAAMPFSHKLSLGNVGLQAHDYVACGFDRADVIICVGFDMVEYHPHLWHEGKDKKIIRIDPIYAEVDEHYILEVGAVDDIAQALDGISAIAERGENNNSPELRKLIVDELTEMASDTSFPMKPQRILCDARKALGNEYIVISDVGAHKM